MSSIELQLVPEPGKKPEFLATLEAASTVGSSFSLWSSLVVDSTPPLQRVVLEGYTRDAWALSFPTNGSQKSEVWQSMSVRSIDGRNKLPGFVTYLQQRNKVAYGRFSHAVANSHGSKMTGVWIIPPQKQSSNNAEVMSCWIAMDIRRVPNCTLVSNNSHGGGAKQQQQQAAPAVKNDAKTTNKPTAASSSSSATTASKTQAPPPRKRGGLLGNLVGAQKRTNEHLSNVPAKKPEKVMVHNDDDDDGLDGGGSSLRTAAQVLDAFRQNMEQKLLDFDTEEHETMLEIPLRISEHVQGLNSQEERAKVSMEVLKYLVQEQAEEINEEWVVHQPPSEFLDEITLVVYKEAPPDVLEEMNQGILPEEVRQQQRAIQSERQKAVNQAEAKRQAELRAIALRKASQGEDDEDDDVLARLNTNKRDRRTVEDFQREAAQQQHHSKKSKST